jgi:hypothetical protein
MQNGLDVFGRCPLCGGKAAVHRRPRGERYRPDEIYDADCETCQDFSLVGGLFWVIQRFGHRSDIVTNRRRTAQEIPRLRQRLGLPPHLTALI